MLAVRESDVMIEQLWHSTVGDIVAADYRAARIFERFGIDFCCGGKRSLADACRRASAEAADVIRALDGLPAAGADPEDVRQWPIDRLIDHITTTHHAYVRGAIPAISAYLAKLQEVHGARHPELTHVAAAWDRLSAELGQHMLKEEQVLFPYVRDLAEHSQDACGTLQSPFGSVQNPIRMMEREHRDASDELGGIRELADDFRAPADGCTTYAVCMAELAHFEQDLHRHVHLENNVLFPRALEMESGPASR